MAAVLAVGSVLLAGCSLLPGGGSDAEPTIGATVPTTAATAAASPSRAPSTDGPAAPSVSISGFPSSAPSPTKTSKDAEKGLAVAQTRQANWQSSPAGLTFYFAEYQLGGAGIRTYTVPWSRAGLVLSAYGESC